MERVAFLLPHTGAWIRCMLNPESFSMQRRSGVRQPGNGQARLSGRGFADDPVLVTGGGSTRLVLDLLFDVTLAYQTVPNNDVRHISDPIWRLADAAGEDAGMVVRLVWGKSWNIPGVVMNAAQRFDDFQRSGIPRRNWMRLDFRRVGEEEADHLVAQQAQVRVRSASQPTSTSSAQRARAGAFIGGQRIDLLADQHLGDAHAWRELAASNNIDDPVQLDPSRVLRLPESP